MYLQASANLRLGNLDGAAQIHDQILAANVQDTAMFDHLPTRSAQERANIATMQQDMEKFDEIVEWVEKNAPDYHAKQRFFEMFGSLIEERK